jgi:hypothetical protein
MTSLDDTPARVRWARLRFQIIGPLFAAPPDAGELQRRIEELAARSWRHPSTGEAIKEASQNASGQGKENTQSPIAKAIAWIGRQLGLSKSSTAPTAPPPTPDKPSVGTNPGTSKEPAPPQLTGPEPPPLPSSPSLQSGLRPQDFQCHLHHRRVRAARCFHRVGHSTEAAVHPSEADSEPRAPTEPRGCGADRSDK